MDAKEKRCLFFVLLISFSFIFTVFWKANRGVQQKYIAPYTRGEEPVHRDKIPVHRDESPVYRDKIPVHRDESPVYRDEIPVHRDETPVYRDEIPVQRDEIPVHRDETPVYRDEIPIHRDETPVYRDEIPGQRDERNKTSQHRAGKAFYRTNTTPEKTRKLPFLENYKNPCWRETFESHSEKRIRTRCLPYFYLVGAPKSGTTDLHARLVKHPLISSKVTKEPHWLSRKRFYGGKSKNLSEYLRLFNRAVQYDVTRIQQSGYFNTIFGDCSASTLWDNSHLLKAEKNRNMTIPPYTNANVIYNLNPNTKIIIILRNPITRLYSDYLYFNVRQSAEEFHSRVIDAVNYHTNCLKSHNIRYCAYFVHSKVRFHIGLYHIYIEDYMRVFPRDQIKILKLEDYSKNIAGYMKDVFKFLGTGLPPDESMLRITNQGKANANTRRHKTVGDMLPKTYKILYNFYKPYNDQLVELLGNKFNYN